VFFCCDFDAPNQLLFGNGWKIWRWMDLSRFCIWHKYFILYTSIVWIFCPLLPVNSLLCVYDDKSYVAKLLDVSLYLYLAKLRHKGSSQTTCIARWTLEWLFVLDGQFTSYYFQNQMVWIWLRNCFFTINFSVFLFMPLVD